MIKLIPQAVSASDIAGILICLIERENRRIFLYGHSERSQAFYRLSRQTPARPHRAKELAKLRIRFKTQIDRFCVCRLTDLPRKFNKT
jgi:hypothetical protein